jgi:hypothetical protein
MFKPKRLLRQLSKVPLLKSQRSSGTSQGKKAPYTPKPDLNAAKNEQFSKAKEKDKCEDLDQALKYEQLASEMFNSYLKDLFISKNKMLMPELTKRTLEAILGIKISGLSIQTELESQYEKLANKVNFCDEKEYKKFFEDVQEYMEALHDYVTVWSVLEEDNMAGMTVKEGMTYATAVSYIKKCPLGSDRTILLNPRKWYAILRMGGSRSGPEIFDSDSTEWKGNEKNKLKYFAKRFQEIVINVDVPGKIGYWESSYKEKIRQDVINLIKDHPNFESITARDVLDILASFAEALKKVHTYHDDDEKAHQELLKFMKFQLDKLKN